VREDATLLPTTARVLREVTSDDERARLATGDGWTIRAIHWPISRKASVTVTAETPQLCADIVSEAPTA
jgi:hypothetical protein